jgi:hypothetical protein
MQKKSEPGPSELELMRQLADQASRASLQTLGTRRQVTLQRLMAKALCLNDQEFETAVGSFEGLVERFTQAKVNGQKPLENSAKDPVKEAEKKLSESINRTP